MGRVTEATEPKSLGGGWQPDINSDIILQSLWHFHGDGDVEYYRVLLCKNIQSYLLAVCSGLSRTDILHPGGDHRVQRQSAGEDALVSPFGSFSRVVGWRPGLLLWATVLHASRHRAACVEPSFGCSYESWYAEHWLWAALPYGSAVKPVCTVTPERFHHMFLFLQSSSWDVWGTLVTCDWPPMTQCLRLGNSLIRKHPERLLLLEFWVRD